MKTLCIFPNHSVNVHNIGVKEQEEQTGEMVLSLGIFNSLCHIVFRKQNVFLLFFGLFLIHPTFAPPNRQGHQFSLRSRCVCAAYLGSTPPFKPMLCWKSTLKKIKADDLIVHDWFQPKLIVIYFPYSKPSFSTCRLCAPQLCYCLWFQNYWIRAARANMWTHALMHENVVVTAINVMPFVLCWAIISWQWAEK